MKASYKVTDPELFSEKVVDVDIQQVRGWEFNIAIELTTGKVKEIQGEFSTRDFEEEYGFIIIYKV